MSQYRVFTVLISTWKLPVSVVTMPRPKPVILFMDLPRASVLFLIFQYSTVGAKIILSFIELSDICYKI